MRKPLFAMALGGILGVFDGLTALFYPYPDVQSQIAGIVIGSTVKGIATGLLVGLFEKWVQSLVLGVLFGLAVGLFFAYLVARTNGYYWEIMMPGAIVGLIVGYATYKYGDLRPSMMSQAR